jgi:hypothetical protein
MMFNHLASSRLYLGSDQGLMYMDVAAKGGSTVSEVSSISTPCNVALCGKVLTISNDGKLVVVSDTVSTPSQVYIYNSGGGTADLIIPGETATAAAFSPDQLKLFILTNAGNMYVYSTVDALTSVPIATSASDVKFSADGSFAYIAGTPAPGTSISGFATCNPQLPQGNLGFVTTPGIPTQIFPSPDAQHVIAIDPPNIDIFTASDTQIPLPDGQFTCTDPSVTFGAVQSHNLGQGNFTSIYAQLVADGTAVILVANNIPAVLVFNVGSGTTTSIPLVGGSTPLSASASTDGSQVYVAACDQYDGTTCAAGSVHIVCTSACSKGQGDFLQVPYANINENNNPNMCNSQGSNAPLCLPNLIAIKPQ